METLDENATCRILSKLDTRERCKIQLVCKEWQDILSPDSCIAWEIISAQLEDFSDFFLQWLQCHAFSVRQFDITPSWSNVSRLAISRASQVLQAMQAFASRLEVLSLNMPSLQETHQEEDAIPRPGIANTDGKPLDKLMIALFQVSQIKVLDLTNFVMPETPSTFSSITMLTCLTTLKITKSDAAPLFEPDQAEQFWNAICSLSKLENLSVVKCRAKNVGQEKLELPPLIGDLDNLRVLEIRDSGLGILPESFVRLQKLETFIFIESPQDCTILKHLQSLTSLTIAAENSRACSKIPNLKELTVEKRPAASHLCKMAPKMTGIWNLLEDLDLSNLNLSKVPNAVTTMATLKRLTLRNNALSTLTPGPYLRALENLDLAYNSFCGVPQALKEAQNLARLSLKGNEDLGLNQESVDLILSMKNLVVLDLRKEFCDADDEFMDMDLCTGWGPASLKSLGKLRRSAPSQLEILCNV